MPKRKPEPVRPDPKGVFRLTILGPPKTKTNARGSMWSRKANRVIHFKPGEVEAYEVGAAGQAITQLREMGFTREDMPIFRHDGLEVRLDFFFPHNPSCRDVDNYPKSICDALKGILWTDDRLIHPLHLDKHKDKERPRIEIEVRAIEKEV